MAKRPRGDLNDTGISRVQLRHVVMPLTWALLILGLRDSGTDLPQETLLDLLHVDKAIHGDVRGAVLERVRRIGQNRDHPQVQMVRGLALVLYGIGLEFARMCGSLAERPTGATSSPMVRVCSLDGWLFAASMAAGTDGPKVNTIKLPWYTFLDVISRPNYSTHAQQKNS